MPALLEDLGRHPVVVVLQPARSVCHTFQTLSSWVDSPIEDGFGTNDGITRCIAERKAVEKTSPGQREVRGGGLRGLVLSSHGVSLAISAFRPAGR